MLDQAQDLRRLATECRPIVVRATGRPRLLALCGGKGGVGTTTMAIRLAKTMAHAGRRTLLVDADPRGGDAALHCGAEERHTLADLLAGRRNWAEVIAAAADGIQLVAGARWTDDLANRSSAADRLLELLADSSLGADVVVVDVGNNPGQAGNRICWAADALVIVTTSEPTAVVSTFAAIDRLVHDHRAVDGPGLGQAVPAPYLMVNMARSPWDARMARHRLAWACRRLLGVEIIETDFSGDVFARDARRRRNALGLASGEGAGVLSGLLAMEIAHLGIGEKKLNVAA